MKTTVSRFSLVLISLQLLFLNCSSDKIVLVLYSPHGKELLEDFSSQFENQNPGVRVSWLDMGSQDVLDRVRSEKNNPQGDIWWGAPSWFFMNAADEGLLQPYQPSWADGIDASRRDSLHRWYGTFLTPEVITFNSQVLTRQTAPQDWDDMVDEKWRGKIAIRNPVASGTMRAIFAAIIWRSYSQTADPEPGFNWLLQLDANTKSYPANPTLLYLQLARREAEVTLWNLPDIELQKALYDYPLDYNIPASGTPVLVEGIGILANSRQPELAKKFYEFVTSQEAFRRQAELYYRIPARNDITAEMLPEWIRQLKIEAMDIDWRVLSQKSPEWLQYWDKNIKGKGRR
jgi:iron(III) transport system substrate-binding protein